MKAMLLAAGKGTRMRPLTDHTPKPLLKVGGKALIEWHIERLRKAGVREIVINTAHLGEQLPEALGDGARFDVQIQYSHEGECLETGGGILRALPLLQQGAPEQPFLVISADVWCDYEFARLCERPLEGVGELVLVPNPAHHPQGDFWLRADGRVANDLESFGENLSNAAPQRLTYSGIAKLSPALFAECTLTVFPLSQLFRQAIQQRALHGVYHAGEWMDVGTPQRLDQLDKRVRQGFE